MEVVADGTLLAQKVLSCVVRCDQRWGGNHIAEVLRGAKTQRIERSGHDQLTTYGLLASNSTREIRIWIDQLIAHELLATRGGEYPTLYLTQTGAEVLKGEREVTLFQPRRPPKKSKRSGGRKAAIVAAREEGDGEVDEALFEHLRKLRRDIASERGVPPYILFNDRTLAAMAAAKPRTRSEFLDLKGIGEKKASDLGQTFLEAIAKHDAAS